MAAAWRASPADQGEKNRPLVVPGCEPRFPETGPHPGRYNPCTYYVAVGGEELDQAKLTPRLKYHDSIADACADLGRPEEIGKVFSGFQKYLYQHRATA